VASLNAYLYFNGNCREAFEFYKSCFGGELAVQTVGESPMGAQWPAETQKNVLHTMLTSGSITLMGADNMRGETSVIGNAISLCLVCSSKEEIEALFASLSEGGKVNHPLKAEFFGTYGDLTDKFGLSWMFQFGSM
jgi:PhnB protein